MANPQRMQYQWWKVESLPAKIWNKTRMPTLITSLQHSIVNPSHSNQIRKRTKGIQIERKEVKLSLHANDTIWYTEYPKNSGSWWWTGRPGMLQFMGSQSQTQLSNWTELKDSIQKLLELINDEFNRVAGHKINIQKLAAFLHTSNEISEKECLKKKK